MIGWSIPFKVEWFPVHHVSKRKFGFKKLGKSDFFQVQNFTFATEPTKALIYGLSRWWIAQPPPAFPQWNAEVSGRLSGSELLKRPFPKSLISDDAFADLRANFFQSELVLDELRQMRSGWKVTSRLVCCCRRSAGFGGSVWDSRSVD